MCDNFIMMGDFNIDVNLPSHGHGKLEEFCNLFDVSNLIKSNTCFTKTHSSKIDLILTNNSNSFQESGTTETGLNDFHKLKSTFFKSHFSRLSPKAIYYRNYKNFDESKFIEDLIYTDFSSQSDDPNENYSFLTTEFSKIVEKHAPLRKKFIRGNHAPFMNKELRKAICTRSRLRNKFCKSPSKENEALHKKQPNKCVSLKRKSIKKYFNDITNYGISLIATYKNFWNLIKSFLTNKGQLNHQDITIFDGKKIITNETELVEVFNYINIVEKSSGKKSRHVARDNDIENKRIAIQVIKKYCESQPSIKQIQENFQHQHITSIPYKKTEEVKKLLKEVMPKKLQVLTKFPQNWLN